MSLSSIIVKSSPWAAEDSRVSFFRCPDSVIYHRISYCLLSRRKVSSPKTHDDLIFPNVSPFSPSNFLARLAIGHVSFCPGYASVVSPSSSSVRYLFTFKSSLKPLNRSEPSMPDMFIGWSCTRFLFLVLI